MGCVGKNNNGVTATGRCYHDDNNYKTDIKASSNNDRASGSPGGGNVRNV